MAELQFAELLAELRAEIKRLRKFIRKEYDKFNEYHPSARELLRTYPWLAEPAETPESEERIRDLEAELHTARNDVDWLKSEIAQLESSWLSADLKRIKEEYKKPEPKEESCTPG